MCCATPASRCLADAFPIAALTQVPSRRGNPTGRQHWRRDVLTPPRSPPCDQAINQAIRGFCTRQTALRRSLTRHAQRQYEPTASAVFFFVHIVIFGTEHTAGPRIQICQSEAQNTIGTALIAASQAHHGCMKLAPGSFPIRVAHDSVSSGGEPSTPRGRRHLAMPELCNGAFSPFQYHGRTQRVAGGHR